MLQETNLDLWRKASTYDASRPFLPWVRTIAHYQVLTFRKKQSRSHLFFDDAQHPAPNFEVERSVFFSNNVFFIGVLGGVRP